MRLQICDMPRWKFATLAGKFNYFNFTQNAKRSLEQSANAEFVMLNVNITRMQARSLVSVWTVSRTESSRGQLRIQKSHSIYNL